MNDSQHINITLLTSRASDLHILESGYVNAHKDEKQCFMYSIALTVCCDHGHADR